MPGIVEASGLRRRFARTDAVSGVDLTVTPGEAIALFGPNGAGKTTLLRMLATLLRPTGGTLRLFGRSLGDGGAEARQRLGFLSHQSFLYPDLTPTENLEFYARMYAVGRDRVRALLDAVGLTGWAHRPVRTLSRGLEQRCALARVLLHAPELLLLDEPFTGLDIDGTAVLSATLRAAHAQGTTLVLTTHDLWQGLGLCSRAIVLVRGHLIWDAPVPAGDREAFIRRYEALTRPEAAAA